jgi:hypothetical protein
MLFWNERDLNQKLTQFNKFYNSERAHSSLNRTKPDVKNNKLSNNVISIQNYHWKKHAGNLFQLPAAS